MWPVVPLAAVTGGTEPAKSAVRARPSVRSLSRVEVPWAFTWLTALRRGAGIGQRQLHGAASAQPLLVGRHQVVGVGAGPVAGDDAQDRAVLGHRVVVALQHHEAGALPEHEAVAILVERP